MRLDEEEVLIRDDSGLLHGGESSYPARQNGWCQKLTRTLSLSLGFFVLGLSFAIPGPTLPDLGERVQATVTQMMMMFAARSAGYLLGSVVGGVLFDCFDKQLLLFSTLLISSVATVAIPWSLTLVVMATMFGLQGITMGVLDTGGNVFCVRLWGKKSGPYIQTLHFAFGIGAFIAPLLATPFLSREMVTFNSSFLEGNIPVSTHLLDNIRQNRSVRSNFMVVDTHYNYEGLIKDSHAFKSGLYRVKREDGETTSGPAFTPTTSQSTLVGGMIENTVTTESSEKVGVNVSINENNETDKTLLKADKNNSLDNTGQLNEMINKTINGASDDGSVKNEDGDNQLNVKPSAISENATRTSSPTSLPVLLPQSTVSGKPELSGAPTNEPPIKPLNKATGPVKKPSAATDNGLKKSFIDGGKIKDHLDQHMDEAKPDNDDTENTKSLDINSTLSTTVKTEIDGPDTTPAVQISSENTGVKSLNGSNFTTITSALPSTHNNMTLATVNKIKSSSSDSSESSTIATTIEPEVPLTTSAPESPGAGMSSTKVQVTPNSSVTGQQVTLEIKFTGLTTIPNITTTNTNTINPTTSEVKNTTEIKTTTTTQLTTAKLTNTEKTTTITPTTVTTTTTSTMSTTQQPKTTASQAAQTTVKRLPSSTKSIEQQNVSQEPGPASDNSSSFIHTTSINSSANSTTASPGPPQVTQISTKPSTAKDSFLSNAIQVIKNISRIQFAYLIIGIVLFINAVMFLVLYCKDKGRLAAPNDASDFLSAKNLGNCYRSMLTVLMGLFLLCYMGLEVTYGALVTSFVIDFLHWPTAQGATVAAIFWGSLAAGRGFSIFIASCCGPVVMLSIDLVLMVVGGLCLAIGLYFYAKLIWLGTVILGLGMSSVFPASLFWVENHLHLTGKTTAVFTLGSGLGQIIFPTVTGYFFEHYEKMVLMQITAGTSVFLLVLFVVIQCFASSSTQKVYVRDRNGFLPLEDDEEENVELDLIHFDKSETRRRRDKRARGETEYKTLISDLDDD